MQGLVLGLTGMGKMTLLKNIITQDLMRVIETPVGPKRMLILIWTGKASESSSRNFYRTSTMPGGSEMSESSTLPAPTLLPLQSVLVRAGRLHAGPQHGF